MNILKSVIGMYMSPKSMCIFNKKSWKDLIIKFI